MSSALGILFLLWACTRGEAPGVVAGESKGVARGVSQGEAVGEGRAESAAPNEETADRNPDMVECDREWEEEEKTTEVHRDGIHRSVTLVRGRAQGASKQSARVDSADPRVRRRGSSRENFDG